MSSSGDGANLRYIRLTAATLGDQATTLGRDRWMADRQSRDATAYQLHTLAESATRLSDDLRSRHPDVPWRDIAGMRNHLVHGFLRVDPAIVWSTVVRDVPRLGALAAQELDRGPSHQRIYGLDIGR